MKKIFLFSLLMSFLNAKSQISETLYYWDWHLDLISVDGQTYYPPNNAEVSSVFLFFDEENSRMNTNVCSTLEGDVFIDENTWSISFPNGLDVSLVTCQESDNTTFETTYFDIFLNDVTSPFQIGIGVIDPLDIYTLEIESASGNTAYYMGTFLGTNEYKKFDFTLYPNPTKDEFFISSPFKNTKLSINIYDITGKLIITKKNKTAGESINIRNLKSGHYLVSIKDETGNKSIKRIIKN